MKHRHARSSRHGVRSLALVATALFAFTGCSSGTGLEFSPAAEVDEENVLHFALGTDAGCVDPQQVTLNDAVFSLRHLVDSLTDQDPETGEIVPWLATDWDVNDDTTEFRFTLRSDATFSNGEPVNAEAVKANFERILELGARGGLTRSYLDYYEDTEIISDHEFVVKFSEPNAQFMQATSTHNLGLIAPESLEKSDDERCEGVIGSGPFLLDSYVPNEGINLVARQDYDWGSSIYDNRSAPKVSAASFSIVPESGVRAGLLQSGQVDAISSVAPQDIPALEQTTATLHTVVNPGVPMTIRMNHDNPLIQEHAVRKAISLAINRKQLAEVVYPDDAPVATSILASTTPGHADFSEELRYDPDEAIELLTDAGFSPDEDGVMARDGERLEFDFTWAMVFAPNSAAVELLQQQLAEVGIATELHEDAIAQWNARVIEGNYDIDWFNTTRADGDHLRTIFDSRLGNISNLPENYHTDEALALQSTTLDPDVREEALYQAQKALVEDYTAVPIIDVTNVVGTSDEVSGTRFDAAARVRLNDITLNRGEE
ncbi:ABC transporter substrate-binding protein [Auritidibacter ignavus]|uniref:ABC transporter substrate-binding protein n=1 Tax=Auritidibacter ignavus TaxID=678932 RepID=UPI000F0448EB|nr:ABC transporter substrate-binding protein [Auritidibacter ignavus]NIH70966.1 peptide/nickel transport system substrate-binding protein [Auritidibacter ignavus]RMX24129.1 ABC transporter substrate-binding protein [Auritidibacter ignavus]